MLDVYVSDALPTSDYLGSSWLIVEQMTFGAQSGGRFQNLEAHGGG